LLTSEIVNETASVLCHLIERSIKNGDDFDGRAGALLHSFEQLEAIHEASKAELDSLRIEFGLPPIPKDDPSSAG